MTTAPSLQTLVNSWATRLRRWKWTTSDWCLYPGAVSGLTDLRGLCEGWPIRGAAGPSMPGCRRDARLARASERGRPRHPVLLGSRLTWHTSLGSQIAAVSSPVASLHSRVETAEV